jgi:hypothetical protein
VLQFPQMLSRARNVLRSLITRIRQSLTKIIRGADAPLPQEPTVPVSALRTIASSLNLDKLLNFNEWQQYRESCHELAEARQMAGAGPWLTHDARTMLLKDSKTPGTKLRESNPLMSQGAFGDIELALQNVEWRREINLSWLEFSRWGIQQIILISRLYYIKNPIVRRLIDISAIYVFGRGYEVSSDDPDANAVLEEFFERNNRVLGQTALVDLERRKCYDGNLFFGFFVDAAASGQTSVRMIDATEMMDIITDPDDTDQPWYYRRVWVARKFDSLTGQIHTQGQECYHPALGFNPTTKPKMINAMPVMWDVPVYHRKCGAVAKWNFGCPLIYPAIDWAKAARRFLEACATVKQALATIAMTVTTKGGQQAIEGLKQQLSTTVGPQAAIWDTNPPPVNASTIVSGPGTTFSMLDASGKGGNPEEVRRFLLMCCMTIGVPETFLSDVSTGNLATATTLDRPTELVFLEKQESWRDDLTVIAKFVLDASKNATSGTLKEALKRRDMVSSEVSIRTRVRSLGPDGRWHYVYDEAVKTKKPKEIKIVVNFPAIREGDMAVNVNAIASAMTLNNKGGQIVGIDEKEGVLLLFRQLGVEDAEEIVELMYPEDEYDPDRTKEEEAAPIAPAMPNPAGTVQTKVQGEPSSQTNPQTTSQPGQVDQQPLGDSMKEAVRLRMAAEKLIKAAEKMNERNAELSRA